MTGRLKVGLAVAALLAAAGVGAWMAWPATVIETPAAAETQSDGSIVLERKLDAPAKPAAQIPRGGKVERVVSVTVKPKPGGTGLAAPMAGQAAGDRLIPPPDCPPVKVDMTLVRMPDQTRRVVASSPDGEIVGGMDVPVETAAPPPERMNWAAGLSWDPLHRTPGAWIERDIARLRLGAELNRTRLDLASRAGTEMRLRIGMTF